MAVVGLRPRREADVSKSIIKESALRAFVKVLLEDKSLGPAMLNVNNVVDPSAAVTDPSNLNFRPQSPVELKIALNVLADEVPQDNIPDIYKRIKDALDSQEGTEGNSQMEKSNKKIEEAVRMAIRQMIRENVLSEANPLPRPKFTPPSSPLVAPKDAEFDTKGMSAAERKAMLGSKKWAATASMDKAAQEKFFKDREAALAAGKEDPLEKLALGATNKPGAQKPTAAQLASLRSQLDSSTLGSEEDKTVGGKKNMMGDVELRTLAAEFGYKNPNGAAQFIEKVLQKKVKQRMENPEAYEIATLEAMNDYIQKMLDMELITPEDADLMKQNPQFIGQVSLSGKAEDPEDEGSFFRTKFLSPRLKKLDKMFVKSGD